MSILMHYKLNIDAMQIRFTKKLFRFNILHYTIERFNTFTLGLLAIPDPNSARKDMDYLSY